jgi:adenylosuccinate lyase
MNSTPENHALTALSPLDGRYTQETERLKNIFSEFGLMKARLRVELAWLQLLSHCKDITEVPTLSREAKTFIEDLIKNFSLQEAADNAIAFNEQHIAEFQFMQNAVKVR